MQDRSHHLVHALEGWTHLEGRGGGGQAQLGLVLGHLLLELLQPRQDGVLPGGQGGQGRGGLQDTLQLDCQVRGQSVML